jgi:hypothetical protein
VHHQWLSEFVTQYGFSEVVIIKTLDEQLLSRLTTWCALLLDRPFFDIIGTVIVSMSMTIVLATLVVVIPMSTSGCQNS